MAEANPDQAALDAVSAFFDKDDNASAANEEVPLQAGSLYPEQQQQDDELEEEGLLAEGEDTVAATKADKTVTTPAKVVASETATLDADLKSIAKEFGWTDAKIDRLFKADPELARETFEQLAANLADQSRSFLPPTPATHAAVQKQAGTAQQQATQQASLIPPELSDEALKKYADANGQEQADMLKLMRDKLFAPMGELQRRLEVAEQAAQAQELKAVATEATSVIDELATKHPSIYGKGNDLNKLTVQEYNRRHELTSLADQIRIGAASQGRQLSVKQAITHAHYIMSKDAVQSESRQAVVAAVQKRAKGVVQRPTNRVNPANGPAKRTDASAAEAYSKRMVELGLGDE